MEPITHFLTGACIGRAGLNRKTAYATLAAVLAWTICLEPFESGTTRDEVAFTLQTGHPEAVNDVVRIASYRNRPPDRDVKRCATLF